MLLFLCTLFCTAQNYKVVYDVFYKPSLSSSEFTNETMQLIINPLSGESLYEDNSDKNVLTQSTKESAHSKINLFLKEKELQKGFYNKIYKNLKTRRFEIFHSIDMVYYKEQYDLPLMSWKLESESKIIEKFNCKKATISFGGRNWTTWYTTEIPFSDGPYKFFGLPGLILELRDDRQEYNFTFKAFFKLEEDIQVPKYISVTEKQLQKLQTDFIADPSAKLRQSVTNSSYSSSASFNGAEVKVDKEFFDRRNQKIFNWLRSHSNPLEKESIWLK